MPRLRQQPPDLDRVGQEPLSGPGQRHPTAAAVEERHLQGLLQRPDPPGDVRLHGVEPGRRAPDAAGLGDGGEEHQVGAVHAICFRDDILLKESFFLRQAGR